MALADYTDNDSIRATLGVSDDELPDVVLNLPLWGIMLNEGLLEIAADLPTTYDTIKGLTPPRTSDQQRFLDLTSTFSAYYVASRLLGPLPVFAPQTLKAVKDQFTRVPGAFDGIQASVAGGLSYIKEKLVVALQVVSPSDIAPLPVTRVWGVSTGLANDPVTNTST